MHRSPWCIIIIIASSSSFTVHQRFQFVRLPRWGPTLTQFSSASASARQQASPRPCGGGREEDIHACTRVIISALRRARGRVMRALCRVAFPRSLRGYSRIALWQAVMLS
ncbi:hypothetical protein BJV74DRAFT_808293 [Russula compacta]|nr:hypothetical protein BJV74DRAFT_808293 [Russula compacta]